MTDLIAVIFWSFLGILALASLVAMIRMGYGEREKGPWVVTRVGVGGREFRALVGPMEWVSTVRMAYPWSSQTAAELEAKRRLADVAPLSQFTNS